MAVAQPGEPAGGFLRQAVDVLPHREQEHQLAELGQDRLAAGERGRGLLQREADQPVGEVAAGIVTAQVEKERQRLEERGERSRVETQGSAVEARLRAAPTERVEKNKPRGGGP